MPTVSEFYGIFIYIRYLDHNPPHFHARYGDQEAVVDIESGSVKGTIPDRALRLILEWLDLHREDVLKAWCLASSGQQPECIEPLK